MPELPEIETIKEDLRKIIVGKKVIDVKIFQKKSVKNNSDKFIKILKSNFIKDIKRKGKLLTFELKDSGNYLLCHLAMTGQLIYKEKNQKNTQNQHTRVVIIFQDKSKLYFNDIRRFGYLKIANESKKNEAMNKMGIDVISKKFNLKVFKINLENKKGLLKAILLNQKVFSGIGNIYADEICFDAKLRPDKKIETLNNKEIKELHHSIRKIIRLAIKYRGTSFSDYVDVSGKKGEFVKLLRVYKKEKQKCVVCKKQLIEKIKISGRSTRYCQNCQK